VGLALLAEEEDGGVVVSFMLPPFLKTRVRLLPLPVGAEREPFELRLFFDHPYGRQLVLPSTFGFPDPVWEARHLLREAERDGNTYSRFLYPVLVRHFLAHHERDRGFVVPHPTKPLVLSVPLFVKQHMRGYENAAHLTEGRDVTIKRVGKGIDTTYHVEWHDPIPAVDDEHAETLEADCADFDPADYVRPFNRRRYDELCRRLFNPSVR